MTKSVLERATAALTTARKDGRKLQAIADELLERVRRGDSEYSAPFFVVVEALPRAATRADICMSAVTGASFGSEFEQKAVAGIKKHAGALPAEQAAQADIYNRYAARYDRSGSGFKVQPESVRPDEEITAFVARFGTNAPN